MLLYVQKNKCVVITIIIISSTVFVVVISRPHRYCYRPRSVVCLSVGRSVCHTSETCKTAEPIELSFGLRTQLGPWNHVLDRGRAPHCKV